MAIYDTYAELITEDIIKEILGEGVAPTAGEIVNRFNTFTAANDISKPLFNDDNYSVVWNEVSSATKWNNCNNAILKDIKVLYRHMFKITDQSIQNFDRWRTETKLLEGRLDALHERITDLLLISQDTAGYFNFMQDNFIDTSLIDLDNTTAHVNIDKGIVTLGTSNVGATRIDVSDIVEEDIEFTVLSRNYLNSQIAAPQSNVLHAIEDVSNYWQERIFVRQTGPVTVELKIKLPVATTISRLDLDLHQADSNSPTQITPMLSTDNYNFAQLNTTNFSRLTVDKVTFQFVPTETQYIKLIMTKAGFDQRDAEGLYIYEFGIDQVSFYNEAFAANTTATLISEPLFVTDTEGQPEEFSKVVLEVCEDVPENTLIDYYIGVMDTTATAVDNVPFVPIDPLGREISTKPVILDFGDTDEVSVSGITISYDTTAASGIFASPARSYSFITSTSASSAIVSSGTSSAVRYAFANRNERILSHTMASGIQIAQNTLEVWRNVCRKGYDGVLVRGHQNGWGFADPYYKTTVYVENKAGVDIDFGGNPVIIDGVAVIGTAAITAGRHTIMVHKDNWQSVNVSDVANLADLEANDPLYPYNHRYLVEGFAYSTTWSSIEEKIYTGFDIVAEYLMDEISVFDMINNVTADNYSVFARDDDAIDSNAALDGVATQKDESKVFLVKIDETNPDFINEDFLFKFQAANQLAKYARLKAVFSTEDSTIAPVLDSYRINISS